MNIKSSNINLVSNFTSILNEIFSLGITNENSSLYDEIDIETIKYCFKVLIYDDISFDIIKHFVKIYSLRENNITLNINIKSNKERAPDIMAIYLISPSDENFSLIVNDMKNNIFDNYYINIINMPNKNEIDFSNFYMDLMQNDFFNRIYKINIIPINILIYHKNVFSLNLKKSFYLLNNPKSNEKDANEYFNTIGNGLFSSLFVMKTIPLIKYRRNWIGDDIVKIIQKNFDILVNKSPEIKEEFKKKKSLLIIANRDVDLPIMFHHGASLGSMLNDICNIVFEEKKNDNNNENNNNYLIDPVNDYIWNDNLSQPFYTVSEIVFKELKKYSEDFKFLDESGNRFGNVEKMLDDNKKISESIENLRDKKILGKILSNNSNFCTNLIQNAEKRELGKIYDIELNLLLKRNSVNKEIINKFYNLVNLNSIENNNNNNNNLILFDLYRLIIIYILSNIKKIDDNEINKLKDIITSKYKINIDGLDYLLKKVKEQNIFLNSENKKKQNKQGIYNWLTTNINNLMQEEQPSLLGYLIEDLSYININKENNNNINNDSDYLTYNLYKKGYVNDFNINDENKFDEIIVFICGGGCLSEYEYLDDWLFRKKKKHIIYGCDYLYKQNEFLKELEELYKIK